MLGPDLGPLKLTVAYLRRLLEAIAVKLGVDISTLQPPPQL